MYVYLTGRAFLVLFVKFIIEKERYLNFQKDFIIIKFSIEFISQLMRVYKKCLILLLPSWLLSSLSLPELSEGRLACMYRSV